MRAAIRLAVACAALTISASAAAVPVVDLDVAGTLDEMRRVEPARYARVAAVLRDAARLPVGEAERWIRTTYRADDVSFGRVLLVSYPPQRKLSFTMDGAAYVATVTVAIAAAPVPVR